MNILFKYLTKQLDETYESFLKHVFNEEELTGQQKIELATYALHLCTYAMVTRDIQGELFGLYLIRNAALPLLNESEKTLAVEKYSQRMPEYTKIFTESDSGGDDKFLQLSAIFLSNFYNLSQEDVCKGKTAQILGCQFATMRLLVSTLKLIDFYKKQQNQ